jgi:hypothetical protein
MFLAAVYPISERSALNLSGRVRLPSLIFLDSSCFYCRLILQMSHILILKINFMRIWMVQMKMFVVLIGFLLFTAVGLLLFRMQ